MEAAPVHRASRRVLAFASRFVLYLVVLYAVFQIDVVRVWVLEPFSRAQVALTGICLRVCGMDVRSLGMTLQSPNYSLFVSENFLGGCNGLNVVLLLVCAVAAFPAPLRWRGLGIGLGTAFLITLNVIRLLSLYFVGVYAPQYEEVVHVYLWQVVMLLATGVIWFSWSERVHRAVEA